MASRIAAAAIRRTATLSRVSSPSAPSLPVNLIQRRGMGGGGDHHGPPKVNCWSDPMSPSKWKEEHFVIVSLSGWGALIYGSYTFFTSGKKAEKPAEAAH
uniref:Uncharacterized protein n=1 Tax=Kalanchoe fedtschenkoi TaxID=63787 RepID=A0A7N0TL89_KALFE